MEHKPLKIQTSQKKMCSHNNHYGTALTVYTTTVTEIQMKELNKILEIDE